MSEQNFSLNLGSDNDGLTDLRAKWLDIDNQQISITTSGFTDLDNGQYTFVAEPPSSAKYVRFYSAATPSVIFCTLAVQGSVAIPPSGSPDTVTAYLYTRNASGVITAGMTVYYQLVGVDADYVDAWSDEVNSVTSDDTGLANVTMVVGGYYRYWIESGAFRTVHITSDTADPYALPEVHG